MNSSNPDPITVTSRSDVNSSQCNASVRAHHRSECQQRYAADRISLHAAHELVSGMFRVRFHERDCASLQYDQPLTGLA